MISSFGFIGLRSDKKRYTKKSPELNDSFRAFFYATKRIGIHLLSSRLYCRFWNYTKSYAVAFADYTAGRELHPALKIVYSTYGYIIHQEYVLVKYKEQKTLQRKENFLRLSGLFAGFPHGRCCGIRAFFFDLSACIVDSGGS